MRKQKKPMIKGQRLTKRVRRTLASRIRIWQEQLALDLCMATGLVGEA